MAESSIHSLASTLASQPLSMSEPHLANGQAGPNDPMQQQQQHQNGAVPLVPPPPPHPGGIIVNPDGTSSDVPLKRKPGRPKGSGKKPVDPNAEPKIKRPVGRPRKDGLPAGSVGPRRASRPRKRPPGTFAATGSAGAYPYAPPFMGFAQGDPSQTQWRASISAPPMGPPQRPPSHMAFPIDPSLDRDWADLARNRPESFLHNLISALAATEPLPQAGSSLEEAFKTHLASLAPGANNNNTATIPSLYSILKTFWLPSSPVYFSLTASATARTPPEHRFMYWDPHPLVFNGIACPACSTPLINRGRISSGPMKVFDLGKPFYVIGCEYVCKSTVCITSASEGRRFASTDVSILRSLPPKLQDEFPAQLLAGAPDLGSGPEAWNWNPMGVSIALWNMARASLRLGLRKEALVEVIRSIQLGTMDDFKQEEEEAGEDEEDEDGDGDDAQQVEGELDYQKDKATEVFNETWNASNSAADPNAMQQQQQDAEAGPSNIHPVEANGHMNPPGGVAPDVTLANRPPPPFPPYGQPQTQFMPFPYPYPYFHPGAPPHDPNGNALKRTFSIVDGTPDPSEPLQKRVRHCCKCGSNECKGKGGRAFCQNACQDCGKVDCKGRNSKRPDRTCADAWP